MRDFLFDPNVLTQKIHKLWIIADVIWLKSEKKVQYREAILFASKDEKQRFLNFFLKGLAAQKGPAEWNKQFQNIFILAFEVIVQRLLLTLYFTQLVIFGLPTMFFPL